MSAGTSSRHQEWLEELEPRVRAAVEADIAFYKPDGAWQFEENESEEDREASDGAELTADIRTEEQDSDSVAAAD